MKAKIILLLTGCVAMGMSAFGQVRFVPDDPYNKYSVGLNVGYTTMYGDLSQSNPSPAFALSLSQHMNQSVIVGVELMHGTLSSTEPANKWTTGLASINQYNGLNVHANMSFNEFLHNPHNVVMKTISHLYVGTGVGIIDNDFTKITDKFKTTDPATIDPDFKKSSLAMIVPLNLGLNIYMKSFFGYRGAQFNINYQMNYAFSDYVDGYKFSSATTTNKYNDAFSVLSIGFAIYIGHTDEYQ